jgi:hypothetical protein
MVWPKKKMLNTDHVDCQDESHSYYTDNTIKENSAPVVLSYVQHEISVCIIQKIGNNCFHCFKLLFKLATHFCFTVPSCQ